MSLLRDQIVRFAQSIPPSSIVVDAGAGQCQYKNLFQHCTYISVDSCIGDDSWNFSQINIKADLASIPLRSDYADYVVCTEVLEHISEPFAVLHELHRLLKKQGTLFMTVPFGAREHQVPHDFFRYTRYGLEYVLAVAGFVDIKVVPIEGDFARLYGLMFEAMSHFDKANSIHYKVVFYFFRQFLALSYSSLRRIESNSRWSSTPPLFIVLAQK